MSRPQLLQDRLIAFRASVLHAVRRLPRDEAGQQLARQLVRSAASPAALYGEARDAESSGDYVHKMKIALKELRESAVWIAMIDSVSAGNIDPAAIARECNELTAIFVTCIQRAKGKSLVSSG